MPTHAWLLETATEEESHGRLDAAFRITDDSCTAALELTPATTGVGPPRVLRSLPASTAPRLDAVIARLRETDIVAPTAQQVAQAITGIARIGEARRVLEAAGWRARIAANRITVNDEVFAQLLPAVGPMGIADPLWVVYRATNVTEQSNVAAHAPPSLMLHADIAQSSVVETGAHESTDRHCRSQPPDIRQPDWS